MAYETILYEEDGPIATITLNRPDDGNMFTAQTCHEPRDLINDIRSETRTRVVVLTGAGDRLFCLGGRKDGLEDTNLYPGILPKDLWYTNPKLSAREALGLVNRLVEGDPIEAGIGFAREFSGYSLPVLGFAREAVLRALDLPVGEGLDVEADLATLAFRTTDAEEGMAAFAEKRRPEFKDG